MAEDYITMTGKQFNEEYNGYEFIKVLRRDLTHYGYKYEPNKLNKLRRGYMYKPSILDKLKFGREKFDPNPNCKPGGLYFCKAKHLFTFIEAGWQNPNPYSYTSAASSFTVMSMDRPLIAIVKIPDKAIISVGSHKFKTNMMELGEPIELRDYITNEYILKRSRSAKKINNMYKRCLMMGMHKMADRIYKLAEHKIYASNMCYRFDFAAQENDEQTLRQMLERLSAKNVGRLDYSRKLRGLITDCVKRAAREAPYTALRCCYEEGMPFNLTNNVLLKMVLCNGCETTFEYMVGVGFDIDAVDSGPDIFVGFVGFVEVLKLGPTLLEQFLEMDEIDAVRVRLLIRLGAQISNVSEYVLKGAVPKLNGSDRRLAALISEHVQPDPPPRFSWSWANYKKN